MHYNNFIFVTEQIINTYMFKRHFQDELVSARWLLIFFFSCFEWKPLGINVAEFYVGWMIFLSPNSVKALKGTQSGTAPTGLMTFW